MLSRAIFTLATVFAVLAVSEMAVAAPMLCSARTDVLTQLASKYHERPSSAALTSDGRLLEVLKSDNDATWTILITTPKGVSCLVAAGESWQDKINDQSNSRDPQT
jgi:hypothetical protein